MPSIFCNEKSMWNSFVYVVGYFTALCYGVVIPSCFFYVFSRQYLVLQNSQMTGSAAAHLSGDLRICLYEIRGKSTEKVSRKDENFTRRLVATAAAYISVLVRGPVRVRIEDGIAIVNFDQGVARKRILSVSPCSKTSKASTSNPSLWFVVSLPSCRWRWTFRTRWMSTKWFGLDVGDTYPWAGGYTDSCQSVKFCVCMVHGRSWDLESPWVESTKATKNHYELMNIWWTYDDNW